MFGVLRTILALMVMSQHMLNLIPLGQYAVFCFYIISGYLMTLVMHETYGYDLKGRYRFIINRALRLYPIYWLVIGLTILLIFYLGQNVTRNYNPSLYLPPSVESVFQNFFMVFPAWNPINVYPRLVPPGWALTVELFFYAMICLGMSKTLGRVQVWLFVSLMYVPLTYALGFDSTERYFPIAAGSLPFSIGALIYFYTRKTTPNRFFSWANKIPALWLFVLLIANSLGGLYLFKLPNLYFFQELAFYVNLILGSLLVYKIASGDHIFAIRAKADKFIGDFSYPIYLLHWQVGLLTSFLLFGKPLHKFSMRSVENFLVSLVFIFILSYLLTILVDKPVQKLREKMKG
jgi:peptidoglycan/LPS O-acetylase OafA/YrhL